MDLEICTFCERRINDERKYYVCGDMYCKNCCEKYFKWCESCEQYFELEDFEFEESWHCNDCFDKFKKLCSCCGRNAHIMAFVKVDDGRTMCENCWNNYIET